MVYLSLLQRIAGILVMALWLFVPFSAGNSHAMEIGELDQIALADHDESDSDDSDADSGDSDSADSDSADSDSADSDSEDSDSGDSDDEEDSDSDDLVDA